MSTGTVVDHNLEKVIIEKHKLTYGTDDISSNLKRVLHILGHIYVLIWAKTRNIHTKTLTLYNIMSMTDIDSVRVCRL